MCAFVHICGNCQSTKIYCEINEKQHPHHGVKTADIVIALCAVCHSPELLIPQRNKLYENLIYTLFAVKKCFNNKILSRMMIKKYTAKVMQYMLRQLKSNKLSVYYNSFMSLLKLNN